MRYTDSELEEAKKEGTWPPPRFKCIDCGTIIQSSYPGEHVTCLCAHSYVDQTPHYNRVGGNAKIVEGE